MTDEANPAITSLQDSISSWSKLFKDLNNGGDTRNWQKLAMKELAPAALFGQKVQGISLPGVFRPNERTQISFPAYFDAEPVQSDGPTPAGTKVKFNGKSEMGILVVTDESIKTAYRYGRGVVAGELARSAATHVGEVAAKFSMLSMTSAGSTYEVLFTEDGESVRIMFRIALEPRDRDFTGSLRRLILLSPTTPVAHVGAQVTEHNVRSIAKASGQPADIAGGLGARHDAGGAPVDEPDVSSAKPDTDNDAERRLELSALAFARQHPGSDVQHQPDGTWLVATPGRGRKPAQTWTFRTNEHGHPSRESAASSTAGGAAG